MSLNDPFIINMLYFATGMSTMVLLEHVILEPLFRTRDKIELSNLLKRLNLNLDVMQYWDAYLSWVENPSHLPLSQEGKKELLVSLKKKNIGISFWQSLLRGIPKGKVYYCGIPVKQINTKSL